jgi:hypothetical protein
MDYEEDIDDAVSSNRCKMILPSVSGGSEIIEPPPLRRGQSQDRPRSFAETQSLFISSNKDVVVIVPTQALKRTDPPSSTPSPASARKSLIPSYYKPSYYKDNKNKSKNSNNNSIHDTTTLPVLPVPHVARSAMTAYKANLYAIPSFAIKDLFLGCNDATAVDQVLKSADSSSSSSVTDDETKSNQQAQKRQVMIPHHQISQEEEGHNHGFEVTLVSGTEQEKDEAVLKSHSTDLLNAVDDSECSNDDDENKSRDDGAMVTPRGGDDQLVASDENTSKEALDESCNPEKSPPTGESQRLDRNRREPSENDIDMVLPDDECRLLNKNPKDDDDLSLTDGREATSRRPLHCDATLIGNSEGLSDRVNGNSWNQKTRAIVVAADSSKFTSGENGKAETTTTTTCRSILSDLKNQQQCGGDRDDDTMGPDVSEVSSNPKGAMSSPRNHETDSGGEESPLKSKTSSGTILPTSGVNRKQGKKLRPNYIVNSWVFFLISITMHLTCLP